MSETQNTYILPVLNDSGIAQIPFPMSEEDFELLIATLQLWRRRLVQKNAAGVCETHGPDGGLQDQPTVNAEECKPRAGGEKP